MFAIVEIAGKQYKVENEQELFVNKLQNDSGDSLTFDKVLLVDNDGKAKIGKSSGIKKEKVCQVMPLLGSLSFDPSS